MLFAIIIIISTQKYECISYEQTQDITEEELINYISPLNDVQEALASCNLTSDSLTGEDVTIEYFPESDLWYVKVIASRYSWGTPAKAIEIIVDDDTRLVNVKCETYKQG